jgi:hypothetical protein
MSSIPVASIDYSPSPTVKQITLVLSDDELADARHSQFERFFRVWFTDSYTYAPHLKDLTIILRPSATTNQKITRVGVNAFMENFYRYVVNTLSRNPNLRYKIYLDNYATVRESCVLEYADEQILLESN